LSPDNSTEDKGRAHDGPEHWVKFQYRVFFDVPRVIVADDGAVAYLLVSDFDDALDDYSPEYVIYRMPPMSELHLSDSWTGIESQALDLVGTWPVAMVRFDPSLRAEIDIGFICAMR
jgi:hypothetical protein